jgi:predicted GIY-YIG superfamily endonuclease
MKDKALKIEINLKKLRKKQRIQILINNKTGAGKHKNKKKSYDYSKVAMNCSHELWED